MLLIFSQIAIWYIDPAIGYTLQGACYALTYVSVWTAVLFIVRTEILGQAMAGIISSQQLGYSIGPLLVGIMRRYTSLLIIKVIIILTSIHN
jgi:hypothetical protein